MKTQLISRLAAAVLMLGALGACGEDAEPEADATDSATTEPTESEPTESEPTESEPTETEPTESEPTETESTQGATGGDVDAFCDSFIKLSDDGDDAITAAQGVKEVESLVENSPEEVAADVEVLDLNFTALVDAVRAEGLPLSVIDDQSQLTQKQRTALLAAAEAAGYNPEAANTALQNVDAWATDNCEGYTPSGG